MISIKKISIFISIIFIANQYIQAALPLPPKRINLAAYATLIDNSNVTDFTKLDLSPEAIQILRSAPNINEKKDLLLNYIKKLLLLYHPDKNVTNRSDAEIISKYFNDLRDKIKDNPEIHIPIILSDATTSAPKAAPRPETPEEDRRVNEIRARFEREKTQTDHQLFNLAEADLMLDLTHLVINKIDTQVNRYKNLYANLLNPSHFRNPAKAVELLNIINNDIDRAANRLRMFYKERADRELTRLLNKNDFEILQLNPTEIARTPQADMLHKVEAQKNHAHNFFARHYHLADMPRIHSRLQTAADNVNNHINHYHATRRRTATPQELQKITAVAKELINYARHP